MPALPLLAALSQGACCCLLPLLVPVSHSQQQHQEVGGVPICNPSQGIGNRSSQKALFWSNYHQHKLVPRATSRPTALHHNAFHHHQHHHHDHHDHQHQPQHQHRHHHHHEKEPSHDHQHQLHHHYRHEKEPSHDDGEPPFDQVLTLCLEGKLDKALHALSLLDTVPPTHVYLSLLKACHKRKAFTHAKLVHAHLAQYRVEPKGLLGDYLVVTLAKCGAIDDALHTFSRLPRRTVFSWTAMITAYNECGQGRDALRMYQSMQEEGVEPDHYTFVSLFKACGSIPDLERGKDLHADAHSKGFACDVFIGTAVVSMYGKCGAIKDAENAFVELSQRTVESWNAMLSAYVEQCQGEKALKLYRQMQEEHVSANERTIVIVLRACNILEGKVKDAFVESPCVDVMSLDMGRALHAYAVRRGFASNAFVCTTLVDMYGKCGTVREAENVFDLLSQRDIVSWTTILCAYVEQGQGEKALHSYRQMHQEGVSPDQQSLVIALQACGIFADKEKESLVEEGKPTKAMSLEIGRALHDDALRKGFISDYFVGNTLVSMYGKSGSFVEAENVFRGLSRLHVISWNVMLSAYVEQGLAEKALQLYSRMHAEIMGPDHLTLVIALQACGILSEKEVCTLVEGPPTKMMSLEIGQGLHDDACRKGVDSDLFVGNTLLSMYGKCGAIAEAENVFDELSCRDLVSWNAMLSAYIEQGQGERALELYKHMQTECVVLNDVTIICVLQACSDTGSLEICKRLHFTAVSAGCDSNISLVATLIHAYGSCGSMVDAQAVFDRLPQPVVASCNACIAGYAGAGKSVATLKMFEDMLLAGIKPNELTFSPVLSVCSHAGLVGLGLEYFESMGRAYGVSPQLKHYVCMVDLLGRAGDFKGAENILVRMKMPTDVTIWLCLLAACYIHGNVELGKQVFDQAVNVQPTEAAAYILMANIYADAVLQECAGGQGNRKLEDSKTECG